MSTQPGKSPNGAVTAGPLFQSANGKRQEPTPPDIRVQEPERADDRPADEAEAED
jgi:hypothetical protein